MALSRQQYKTYAACNEVRRTTGMRGNLEVTIRDSLDHAGCPYLYEGIRIPYVTPHAYIPDFALQEQAIFLEPKGYFLPEDRQKLITVRKQHPAIDIRLVFSRSATLISKGSKTTYAAWCVKHDFPYADKTIPPEWLSHKPSKQQREAFDRLLGAKAHGNGKT